MFDNWARRAESSCHGRLREIGQIPSHSLANQLPGARPFAYCALSRLLSIAVFAYFTLAITVPIAVLADGPDAEGEELFRASVFPKGWVFYSPEPNVSLSDIWLTETGEKDGDDVLICTGRPFGYLKTESVFENFELSLEWSYPGDPNCNSGILMCTSGDDKIWPTSIQVQLHRPAAGSVFPIGDGRVDKAVRVKADELALQEWHKCHIRCEGGGITVAVNGIEVAKVTGCNPRKGSIALQSEGSEIRFRRIKLRKID